MKRRAFMRTVAAGTTGLAWGGWGRCGAADSQKAKEITVADLPRGTAPAPLALRHFPNRLCAFLWRNWTLVPVERLAAVLGAKQEEVTRLGRAMGLPEPRPIAANAWRRSALTIIKRNWHLLPYEQLLALLDWAPAQLAYTLREDDFLYVKLGNLKPAAAPLAFSDVVAEAEAVGRIVRAEFPQGWPPSTDELFGFVERLSAAPATAEPARRSGRLSPRFCYSYFALYGDPLLDPYPDGYLARLAGAGVDGVWLQGVLYRLHLFPWQPDLSEGHETRLENLCTLVARARRHGIGLYLYLNEPRAMPLTFFADRPELKGVVEGDHAALCSSHPEVRRYLSEAVAGICRAVPDLAGFFTITASENFTNCWSHHHGQSCVRCGQRLPGQVIAEVNATIQAGIDQARVAGPDRPSRSVGARAPQLIAWDWGWRDAWAEEIINALPREVALMSVSEWSLPIERGGVKSVVGEYSISAIGPGPRAQRHWELARRRGLKTLAKMQAGNTWELSAVPYISALENVAQHAVRLRAAQVDGLMLGWTLGGYPSPNLEVVAEATSESAPSPQEAMMRVARRRFGPALAPSVVTAWSKFSVAFSEFPYDGGVVYQAPLQMGPANLLWPEPTRYVATMVGFPYDDLDGWRGPYPPEIFIGQLLKVADGFDAALAELKTQRAEGSVVELQAFHDELRVAEAAALHFRSAANQARFVLARRALSGATRREEAVSSLGPLESTVQEERRLARRLFELQKRDSRLGFEASNQYYYVPADLVEKILNCHYLLERWLPDQRARWEKAK